MNFFKMIWTISRLRHHWKTAHKFIPNNGRRAHEFRLILIQYTETGRAYHGLSHILHGLDVIDDLRKRLQINEWRCCTLKFAFFYHDVIYNAAAKKGENEQASADFARDYLMDYWRSEFPTIEQMILMTADHQNAELPPPGTGYTQDTINALWPIMNDADLAILAAPPKVYKQYAHKVWLEYQHVYDRPAFVAGRAAFLADFITKPIFKTREMLVRCEPQAIANLKQERDDLIQDIKFFKGVPHGASEDYVDQYRLAAVGLFDITAASAAASILAAKPPSEIG